MKAITASTEEDLDAYGLFFVLNKDVCLQCDWEFLTYGDVPFL